MRNMDPKTRAPSMPKEVSKGARGFKKRTGMSWECALSLGVVVWVLWPSDNDLRTPVPTSIQAHGSVYRVLYLGYGVSY